MELRLSPEYFITEDDQNNCLVISLDSEDCEVVKIDGQLSTLFTDIFNNNIKYDQVVSKLSTEEKSSFDEFILKLRELRILQ